MSEPNPFPSIPITEDKILEQVGGRTFQRARTYAAKGMVVRYRYDAAANELHGLVNGNAPSPYEVYVRFSRPKGPTNNHFVSHCTCPVDLNCKHAVALMLTAIDRAEQSRIALGIEPEDEDNGPQVPEQVKDLVRDLQGLGVEVGTAATMGETDQKIADVKGESRTPQHSTRTRRAAQHPGSPHPDDTPQNAPSRIPTWRRDLSHVLAAGGTPTGIDSARVSGALDLSFSVAPARSFGPSSTETAARINLLARPLMRSNTGRWVKGGLSWETFASSVGGPVLRHEIYPEHERWFAELYSVVRPWQSMYTSHRDWVSLSASGSALLWDVLARAQRIGLPILLEGREINLTVLPPATVKMRATALPGTSLDDPAEGGLRLEPTLGWETRQDGRIRQVWVDAANSHPLGTPNSGYNGAGAGTCCIGFFALGGLAQQVYEQAAAQVRWKTTREGALDRVCRAEFAAAGAEQPAAAEQSQAGSPAPGELIPELAGAAPAEHHDDIPQIPDGLQLAFIPLAEPLDAATDSFITTGTIEVPGASREDFHREYLPALARTVPVLTPDPALNLPQVRSPHLVFEMAFNEQVAHDATTDWYWEYPLNPLDTPTVEDAPDSETGTGEQYTRLPVLGYAGEPGGDIRDARFEARVLRKVRSLPGTIELTRGRTEGWETRDVLTRVLPALRRISGVRVRLLGTVPEFTEATDALIEVNVTEGNSRDWFGLGIAIRVNDWHVPFSQVFEALDRAQDRILLGNGTYFSLNRPEFTALRALIAEARTLNDSGTELRINRRQVGLWDELESLASHVNTVASWDAQVRNLLSLLDETQTDTPEDLSGTENPEKTVQNSQKKNEHSTPGAVREYAFSALNLQAPAGLEATLRPYQLEGFRWLAFLRQHRLGGILADEMGLGKTVQTLALLAHAMQEHAEQATAGRPQDGKQPPFAPFLVVAPTSVVGNWANEAARFVPDAKVAVVSASTAKSGKSIAEMVAGAHLVVTSYALFRIDEAGYTEYGQLLQERSGQAATEETASVPPAGWGALVLDEAQFVKNAATRAWKAARALPADFKLAITGTPMENNLMELWAILAIVADGLFPSARAFRDLYARPAESGEDADAVPRLRRRVGPLMLRRTKEVVAAELPQKNDVRIDIPLNPTHRRIYDTRLQRERQKVLGLLEDMDKNRFTIFQSLTLLRRLALDAALIDPVEYEGVGSAKLEYLLGQLPDLLTGGHRVLVFSQFTGYLRTISQRLEAEGIEHLYLDGATRNRPQVLKDFADGVAPVFLISLKAGGFGLNLTEADHCFIMDPWWNPAAEQQAVDRIHRIGQERDVHVHRLVAQGTIEEKVMDLKESKAALFEAVVNDGSFASTKVSAEQVRQLFSPTGS